jgi:hypothetical protein
MKIAPISGDMIIKLGVGVLILGGIGMIMWTIKSSAGQAYDAVIENLDVVNPASDQNVIYQTVNSGVQAATGSQDATLGTWLYDITHPNEFPEYAPQKTGGATGSW